MMIHIAQPIIEDEEREAVNKVLKSGLLAQGPKVAELEEAFAKYCGTKYSVAVNSGTAALHCALYAAGVKPGDEVITVPFSFIATINPVLMQGAYPVLVDIEPEAFNINLDLLERAITPKTKAIIPVDLYGQPYDYNVLKTIASKHDIKIIEDACQAVGATYQDKKAGDLGDLGCFSLYATKNIMSGEGGVITTSDEAYVKKIKQFRQHGMTAMNNTYEYTELGYNYRMSDLHAAIAVEQLKKADKFNKTRMDNAKLLDMGLAGIKGLILPQVKPERSHVYHQYTIRITQEFALPRDEVIKYLRNHEIGAGIYYPKPLHAYPHIAKLGYKMGDFPEAEKAAKEVLSLPVHPKVTKEDINNIINAIKELASGK
jgi:perosamine synthetase